MMLSWGLGCGRWGGDFDSGHMGKGLWARDSRLGTFGLGNFCDILPLGNE